MKAQVLYQQLPVDIDIRVVLSKVHLALKSVPVIKVRYNTIYRGVKLLSVLMLVPLLRVAQPVL